MITPVAIPDDILLPPVTPPSGDLRQFNLFNSSYFSQWLGLRMEEILKSLPEWQKADPILLGSWAREELSPRSDLDLLFCGEEAAAAQVMRTLNEAGFKARSRTPAEPADWTAGVEAFDILALLKAKPLTSRGADLLRDQQKRILQNKKHFGQTLLRAIREERKKRADRFDSITNFLEPNIKYGPGGLRDLEQGLQVYEFFATKIPNPSHALDVMRFYKAYFLTLRQKLHLLGMNDVLVGAAQFEIARWMGFASQKDFMRDLQRGLSRVSFYSDWLVEAAAASPAVLARKEKIPLRKGVDLGRVLIQDSSVLMQKRVRENLDRLFPTAQQKKTAPARGKLLEKILSPAVSDAGLVAVFRSRLIDKLLPEIKRLVGYVQHDQYHRFTADTHIMQACREFKRIHGKPAQLGAMKGLHRQLTEQDWKVLRWGCLYHDLAKGLESGDHAKVGIDIVRRDFKAYGFSKALTDQVAWLVEHHLELSQAAFRKNPKSPKVWQELREKGIEGAALYRLAVFTAIDIRATNPEAWNEWKARLLNELVRSLESKSAQTYFDFSRERKKKKLKLPLEVFEALDPLLVESLPTQILVEDLKLAEKSETALKPRIVRNRRGQIWVRFHHREDRLGLLADFVQQLYSLGLGIRHAAIQTLPGVGVYDWFQITTTKKPALLEKLLAHSELQSREIPRVSFQHLEVVSQDADEWILSFRGQDQSGLLAAAARALAEHGINVKSARVHTWGRQIEDIFTVKPQGNLPDLLSALRSRFKM